MPAQLPPDDPTHGVVARHASFAYGDRIVLADVDVELRPGSVTYLIGPNGSGKSTLLQGIAGLTEPSAGEVRVHGRRASDHRGQTAFVLQAERADSRVPISVRELVAMGRYARLGLLRRAGEADRQAVERALAQVGMEDLADTRLHDLSGGQRQRAHLAQALAQEADVLLLDEPLAALDQPSRDQVLECIDAQRRAGTTVVVSTHELTDAATGDDVLLLAGRAVAFGPPGEVLVPDVLAQAYGGRVLELHDGTILLDDPAHHHDHHQAPS
jgi:ABC-type Mn2+/Zn2+ transport system ATPase subunit